MDKKTLRDVDLKGKRVVMRVDFNVPIAKDGSGKITDDTRIVAALPSIKYVLEQGGSLVLMSHLGRPKGVKLGKPVAEGNEAFTLKPVAEALGAKLGIEVKFVPDCMAADDVVKALKPGEVALLENTRFYKAEDGKVKKDDDKKGIHLTDEEFAEKKAELKAQRAEMAKKLASYGDIYCNDAFGTAHRAHASTAVIADYIQPAVSGFLLEKEIQFLGDAVENPVRPFVAILGGAKVSSADIIHYVAAHYHCIAYGGAPHKVNIMLECRYLTLFAERLTVFLREAGTNAFPCGCLFFGESFFFRIG